jgi:hypothetical protein
MDDKAIKLKVLEAMKKAMMEDMGRKGMESKKPKDMLVIEKESIGIPKDKLKEEMMGEPSSDMELEEALAGNPDAESPEEDLNEEDLGGGDLLQRIMALRKAKKLENNIG